MIPAMTAVTAEKRQLEQVLRDVPGQPAAEVAAGRGGNLEHHPEPQVDDAAAAGAAGDDARGGDDGHQADAGRDLEGKAERDVEERHQEDPAAEPEHRAEAAGRGAGRDDQRDDRAGDLSTEPLRCWSGRAGRASRPRGV